MATEKQLNTRIINKHDSSTNWKQAVNFTPKEGEIIIYDNNKIKIGDGVTKVEQLSFTVPENIAIADTNNGNINTLSKETLNGYGDTAFIKKEELPVISDTNTSTVGLNAQGQLVATTIGILGPKGDKGEPGRDGLNGARGPVGPRGENGRDGLPGPKGEPGKDGLNGKNGKNGAQGPAGAQGPVGPQGPAGIANIEYSTIDPGAGSPLASGKLFIVYE